MPKAFAIKYPVSLRFLGCALLILGIVAVATYIQQADMQPFFGKNSVQNDSQAVASANTNKPAALTFSHNDVVTTVFWAGEKATPENDYISNKPSAWDKDWESSFGGVDSPAARNQYYPAAFTPKENPFYFALPYNDLDIQGKRKPTGFKCKKHTIQTDNDHSWCKNTWIAIRNELGKVAFAQWEDVGPSQSDDTDYVFGTSVQKNTFGVKAGLDVSPAVRDYLALGDVSHTDWAFVTAAEVQPGPWRSIVTVSPGYKVKK